MDLLFSRYASPFLLLDNLIESGRFSDFIDQFINIQNESKVWDLYINSLYMNKKSYNDFKRALMPKELKPTSENELVATIKNTKSILNNFNPTAKEVN